MGMENKMANWMVMRRRKTGGNASLLFQFQLYIGELKKIANVFLIRPILYCITTCEVLWAKTKVDRVYSLNLG